MNVLILTTAMAENHYSLFQSKAKFKPNPSAQNFYYNLIKSISLYNKTSVVTLRPLNNKMFSESHFPQENVLSEGLNFHYCKQSTNLLSRAFFEVRNILNCAEIAIKDFIQKDFVIVVNSLSYSLMKAARVLSRKYNAKVVSMLTDNPFNLSNNNFVKKLIYKTTINLAKKADGYLSLTKELSDFYNPQVPAYIFEGLVDNNLAQKETIDKTYFFFGGSLYEKYGVKKLIDEFHKSSCTSKLYIAGNGPLVEYIDNISREDSRILYLTLLPKQKIIDYASNALANINPRPLSELDNVSIPSKFFEYLSLGTPIISSKHPKLYELFKNDVVWFDDDLRKTLETFEFENQSTIKEKALSAKNRAVELFGIKTQGELISNFISSIK